MNIERIKAIDIHSHYDHGSKYDRGDDEAHCTQLDYIKSMYDSANIEIAFFSTFASVLSSETVLEENEYNYKIVHENDWMYQWVVVEPYIDETFEQAKYMLESQKCVGIKIHPYNHKYSLGEFGDRIFSFAAHYGTTILLHPEANLNDSLFYAEKYPECNLISAHMGTAEHVDLVERSKHGNIYLDTSGAASSRNKIIEYAVSKIGSDRILFGTDNYASGFQRGRIEYAMISDMDKKNILCKNALRLFEKNIKR